MQCLLCKFILLKANTFSTLQIKSLAAELCLDRAIVLELLREPPPSLLMLSATLPDTSTPSIEETKTLQTTDEELIVADTAKEAEGVKVPVHVMQQSWAAQKRLKKVQIETLESVYRRTKRPTVSIVCSISCASKEVDAILNSDF